MTRGQTHRIRHASGEELLVLAILGSPATVDAIDNELDRRARSPHPVRTRRQTDRRRQQPAA